MVSFLPDASLWVPAKGRSLGLGEDVPPRPGRGHISPERGTAHKRQAKEPTVQGLDTLPRGLAAVLGHTWAHVDQPQAGKVGSPRVKAAGRTPRFTARRKGGFYTRVKGVVMQTPGFGRRGPGAMPTSALVGTGHATAPAPAGVCTGSHGPCWGSDAHHPPDWVFPSHPR